MCERDFMTFVYKTFAHCLLCHDTDDRRSGAPALQTALAASTKSGVESTAQNQE